MSCQIHVFIFLDDYSDEGEFGFDLGVGDATDLEGVDPVDEFGGGGFLADVADIADLIENIHCLVEEVLFNIGEVNFDDF